MDIVKSDFLISLSAVRHPAVYVEKLVNSYLCIYVSPPLTICKKPRHDFKYTGVPLAMHCAGIFYSAKIECSHSLLTSVIRQIKHCSMER